MSTPKPYGRDRLPYPYSYTLTNTYDASDLDVTAPAINQSGTRLYVLEMTDDQVRKFSSALTAGADLIYPLDQLNVIAPYLKARTMDICDFVADCIENSASVQSALADIILNNSEISEAIYGIGIGSEPNLGVQTNDVIYGGALSLAQWIQSTVIDVSEAVVAATELADAFVDAAGLQGLSRLPAGRIAGFVSDISAAGASTIISEADASTLETLTCWIFNTVRCDNGGVYEFDALNNALGSLSVQLGLSKATFALAVSGLFLTLSPATFSQYYILGTNNPDSDWQLICGGCGSSWTSVIDFSVSDYAAIVSDIFSGEPSTYDSVGGYYEGFRDAFGCRGGIVITFSLATVTSVFAEYDQNIVGTANTRQVGTDLLDASGNFLIDDSFDRQQSGLLTSGGTYSGSTPANRVRARLGSRNGSSSFSRVRKVTISGTGTKPPELP